MATRLNGWRRIGLFLVVAWCLSIAGLAVSQWREPLRGEGFFASLDLPQGIFVPDQGPIRLPDGRSIQLQHRAVGEKPWEIDWAREPEVRDKALAFHWSHFLMALLIVPAAAWVLGEGAVWLVRWIREGFRTSP